MDVAILGCGYVGLALGGALAGAGHRVVGVRRSAEGLRTVESTGLDAVRADVTDPGSLESVPDADAVVFAASSGGGDAEAARAVYVDGLRGAIDAFAARERPPDRLLYTSSTGVYGDHDGGWVDESSELRPSTPKAEVLVEAERVARGAGERGMDATVARLGGVYGPGRYRVERYVERPVTEGYLNLIHRDDAGGALRFLLERGAAGGDVPQTVLVVDDEPVWKPDLSAWLAEACGVEAPPVRTLPERLADEDLSAGSRRRLRGQKRCSNDRLRSLGYDPEYPTFRAGYRAAVEEYLAD
jgi:nucleoside-diphosphate-sugar epimerase